MPKRSSRKSAPNRLQTSRYRPQLFLIIVGLLFFFVALYFIDFNPKWQEPVRLKSQNGVLDVTLHATKSSVDVGGKRMVGDNYNGLYPAQTWDVQKGDVVNVHLVNDLTEPTNLHFHGSHVSPKGNSDNVLLTIKPGETFDYRYDLSKNPPGMYWYHPHFHPDVEEQVLGGMVGAIIEHGDVDEIPGIKGVPERIMVLTTVDGANFNAPERLVNGIKNPTLYLRPGQTVRLEVVNASADDMYNFAIPGYKLNVFSRDGNTLESVQQVDNEVMPPGRRIQVLFTPKQYGTIPVKSLYFNQGFTQYVDTTFMNIQVQGVPMLSTKLPTTLLPYTDLRNAHIDNVRTLVFSEGGTDANPTFLFDGKVVNMDRVDQVITLGTTEEWHLINKSPEIHPFHIHINPFQVISVNGKSVDYHGLFDTFGVPANGEMVIRTRYLDFAGKFVLHCHILFHEDHGMMQVVEIVDPIVGSESDNGQPDHEMTQSDMESEMGNMQMMESMRNRPFR